MKKQVSEIILSICSVVLIVICCSLYSKLDHINDELSAINDHLMNGDDERELYLCPYCNSGLTPFTSSLETSVAQLRCYYCGFETPEVHIDAPDAELRCLEKCKENFKNSVRTDEDFVGKN